MDLRLTWNERAGLALSGSTGFVGRALMRALGNEEFIRIASLSDIPEGAVLVHLAAAVQASPGLDILSTNLLIDTAVARWAQSTGAAGLVYASSNNVYPLALGCEVGGLLHPLDDYAASKIVGEALVQTIAKAPWCVLRIADVFGAGQRHGNLFRAIESAVKNKTPLKLLGSGAKLRSYIYIEELASIILRAAALCRTKQACFIANVCHCEPQTVASILGLVAARTNLPIVQVASIDDNAHLDIRTMRATAIDGVKARVSFDSALDQYINAVGGR